jgi:hypothetical protein
MGSQYIGVCGEINNGAHQKPADLIGAPAFIWHQAYWNPVPGTREAREERKDKLDRYIKALHARISANCEYVTPPIKDIQLAYDDRVRVITLQFVWQGVRAKIRIENHTEYVALTSIIDASVDLSDLLKKSKETLLGDNTFYAEIREKIMNFRADTFGAWGTNELPQFPSLAETHNFIYYGIWDDWFFPKILDAEGYLSETEAGSLRLGGLRFVDLRGFITCEEYPKDEEGRETKDDAQAAESLSSIALEYHHVQGPFYKIEEEKRGQWQRNWIPSEQWARRRLDNAWQFLSLAGGEGASPLTGRTEFAVSRLLDGRALYATALAPQPQLGATTPGLEGPLLFYLHSVTQCDVRLAEQSTAFVS